jgi:hypothetical protein
MTRSTLRSLRLLATVVATAGCKDVSGPVEPPPPPIAEVRVIDWNTRASQLLGGPGETHRLRCEGGGVHRPIWGTIVYTDDSSICTAAAHAGLIGTVAGGEVEVTIQPGQGSYPSTARAGITSGSRAAYSRGFSFGPVTAQAATWDLNLMQHRARLNEVMVFDCAPAGATRGVWGTDYYTDDSSLCTAAVHAGLITRATGGRVFVAIRSGRSSYAGSTRNGIRTSSYGSWSGSFSFR